MKGIWRFAHQGVILGHGWTSHEGGCEVQTTKMRLNFVTEALGHMGHQFGNDQEAGHHAHFSINTLSIPLILYMYT